MVSILFLDRTYSTSFYTYIHIGEFMCVNVKVIELATKNVLFTFPCESHSIAKMILRSKKAQHDPNKEHLELQEQTVWK